MTKTITAKFEDGVLKPMEPLDLPAHAEVRVTVELLPDSKTTVKDLNSLRAVLPSLGDDAEAFAQDIRDIRAQFPMEPNPWD